MRAGRIGAVWGITEVGASTLIAIDWGTTAARAYRLDAHGEIRDERSTPLGIARVADGRYAEALATLLGDWQTDPAPRLANRLPFPVQIGRVSVDDEALRISRGR